jgi:hypothetical protein
MSDPTEQAETHSAKCARILGELSELGLTLARDLHARALAAETVADAQAAALAFHRISRSVRQSLALEAKLEREGAPAAQEAVEAAQAERIARVDQRRRQLVRAIDPLIWTEADGDEEEADLLGEEFNARLDDAALAPDFLEIPLETLVARIAADMGLAAEAAAPDAQGQGAAQTPPPPPSDAGAAGRAEPPNSS